MEKFKEENECYNYILKSEFKELASDSSYVGGFEDGFNHAVEQLALFSVSNCSYCGGKGFVFGTKNNKAKDCPVCKNGG